MLWASDARFSLLIHAVRTLYEVAANGSTKSQDVVGCGSAADQVKARVSRFLDVPLDEVSMNVPVNTYSIDSMVAAELRNWLFARWYRDVSLLNLLSATMTAEKLAWTMLEDIDDQLIGGKIADLCLTGVEYEIPPTASSRQFSIDAPISCFHDSS